MLNVIFELIVCRRISSIFYGFQDKLNRQQYISGTRRTIAVTWNNKISNILIPNIGKYLGRFTYTYNLFG